jgi:hypothetical protein
MLPAIIAPAQNRERFPQMGRNIKSGMRWGGGPGMVLARANVDWLAAQSYQDLADVDAQLAKSYRETPKGKDPDLDALRERAQLIVDAQRIITDQYASFAGPRGISRKYWNSVVREAEEVHRLDGSATPMPTPIPDTVGQFDWTARALTAAQDSLYPVAMSVAENCGVQ